MGLVWLHKRLLGVSIEEPGGEQLRIEPDTAGLAHIEGTTMTPKGAVSVSWTPAGSSLNIALPAQVRAHVVLPPSLASLDREKRLKIPSGCRRGADATYLCTGSGLAFSIAH